MLRLDVVQGGLRVSNRLGLIVNVLKVGCQYPDVISLPCCPRNLSRKAAARPASLSCADAGQ
jgi:hypothetical protein